MNMSITLQKDSEIAILLRSILCSRLIHLQYCIQETFCWSQSRSASDGCFLLIRTLQEPSTARGEPEQFRLCLQKTKALQSLSMLSFWSHARLWPLSSSTNQRTCALLGTARPDPSKVKAMWSLSICNQHQPAIHGQFVEGAENSPALDLGAQCLICQDTRPHRKNHPLFSNLDPIWQTQEMHGAASFKTSKWWISTHSLKAMSCNDQCSLFLYSSVPNRRSTEQGETQPMEKHEKNAWNDGTTYGPSDVWHIIILTTRWAHKPWLWM